MKKFISIISSMKVALIILGILLVACTAGSLIPQNQVVSYYEETYPVMSGIILALGLDDVFHCGWFVVLTIMLVINLLACNLVHFPILTKRMRVEFNWENGIHRKCDAVVESDPKVLFDKMGFRKVETHEKEGVTVIYGVRNKLGIWGPWLTHLGMLVVIVGFALGQLLQESYTAYGVAGESRSIEGTSIAFDINSFDVLLREDDTVEQYLSNITVHNRDTLGELTGDVSVNHPLSAFGYKFYQNSTGWAATVDVYKQDELLQSDTICAGEYIEVKDMPGLYVLFRSFYPDYFRDSEGNMMTLSSKLTNPAYVYMLYYGDQMLGMNVLNETNIIKVDDYTIIFRDPENYTLIQVKRDPFEKFTMMGALIMCIAIFLAFYVRAEELWAVKKDNTWEIKGRSVKGGQLFHDALLHEVEKLRGNQ